MLVVHLYRLYFTKNRYYEISWFQDKGNVINKFVLLLNRWFSLLALTLFTTSSISHRIFYDQDEDDGFPFMERNGSLYYINYIVWIWQWECLFHQIFICLCVRHEIGNSSLLWNIVRPHAMYLRQRKCLKCCPFTMIMSRNECEKVPLNTEGIPVYSCEWRTSLTMSHIYNTKRNCLPGLWNTYFHIQYIRGTNTTSRHGNT